MSSPEARHLRVAVVVSRYNDFVTDRLREGAIEALRGEGLADDRVVVFAVPGAYEIPQAARRAAETGRFDAVVCLGCVIRGETPHFDYICDAVAHGIMDAAGETGVPMSFGVLTTNSAEEAIARSGPGSSNKGWEAAAAALQMAALYRRLAESDAAGRA